MQRCASPPSGRRRMERWAEMTPEEREKFREGMRSPCGTFRRPGAEQPPAGWKGGKTVTAIAGVDFFEPCDGRVRTRFLTNPPAFQLGVGRPGRNVCDTITGQPSLVHPSTVKITTLPVATRCGGIYYPNVIP